MVVLPDGEEILDVICGDRDFWIISAADNVAHVKPAKSGAETQPQSGDRSRDDLLVPVSEKSDKSQPDLKVYVVVGTIGAGPSEVLQRRGDGTHPGRADRGSRGHHAGRAAGSRSHRRGSPAVSEQLQFPYEPVKFEKPFFVRAIWHDGQFTYLQSRRAGSCRRSTNFRTASRAS